jgi:hypothetical protein
MWFCKWYGSIYYIARRNDSSPHPAKVVLMGLPACIMSAMVIYVDFAMSALGPFSRSFRKCWFVIDRGFLVVVKTRKPENRIMRYELADYDWGCHLADAPEGVVWFAVPTKRNRKVTLCFGPYLCQE